MIVITGAAGFIASNLARNLNIQGREDLLLVDDFSNPAKDQNWKDLRAGGIIHRERLFEELNARWKGKIEFFFHLGARTDTTLQDETIFDHLNLGYSKKVWDFCAAENIPLVYASSAATYGDGKLGFSDADDILPDLQPLNPYGWSKHRFDLWVMSQKSAPPFWTSLKFFNVYGPGEGHKGRMASVVWHAFNQIKETGKLKLFRSHRPDFKDGEQKRDFIFVNDVVNVLLWMKEAQPASGIYNLGTGRAETFLELGESVFKGMEMRPVIQFIDIPEDIRDAYQYFTEAGIGKLQAAGFQHSFMPLREGVVKYVAQLRVKTQNS